MRLMTRVHQFPVLLQVAALLLVFTAVASAATAVGTCKPTLPSYSSFADAIAGTPDGGTINVCPGTYAEQFTINKDLTIQGVQSGNSNLPVIVPPAGGLVQNIVSYAVSSGFLYNAGLAAQVIVAPGVTVNIKNIALDATGNNLGCNPIPVGIYFADSSGTVTHVAFRNQANTCVYNSYAGVTNYPRGDSIFVQSDGNLPAVVSVLNSSFHNPGWMAMHADGAGANLTAKNNTLVGPGVTDGNGINIEQGAGATITNNSESNALHDGQPTAFWGIILNNCAGNVLVNNNTLSNTQIGINASCSNNTISGNWIFNSQQDGVTVCGSGNTVQSNTINDSGRAAINIAQGCAAQNNNTSYNTIDGACTSVLSGTDATGNTSTPNTVFNTKYLAVSGSTCN